MSDADRAMDLQRQGRLDEAGALYERVLAGSGFQPALRHNLGLLRLEQGRISEALPLLERAHAEDGRHPQWAQSLPLVGMRLYEHGLWESALVWLERSSALAAPDAAVAQALARLRPRPHLAPEAWDKLQQRSLLRYTPRESESYVYAIDVVGTCNLRCPTCPVGNFAAADRPKGFMEVERFERILDKIVAERVAERPQIWLYNWGEPLLHPELPTLVRAVQARGLTVHLSSNLNVERGIPELIRANPDELKVSLSGFTPETYSRTHVRGDLHLVRANLYLLRHWIDKARATTRVWVGHHLYKDTQEQVPAVRALCDELRFEHRPIAAFFQPLERLVDHLGGRAPPDPVHELLIEPPSVYLPRIKASRSTEHDCELRFNQTVINHDGSVALCCSVYDKPNMLGIDFLSTPHAELERAKYRHSFCGTCMSHGLHYSVQDPARVTGPPGR
ncbi:radical SAM protein [Roseateles sp. BYS78W]|uniref:Radical SAM protein n=1 Tax=Pelomonas candidula TaxID=3299025 RepID=A0ABW7HFW1_9BURK